MIDYEVMMDFTPKQDFGREGWLIVSPLDTAVFMTRQG